MSGTPDLEQLDVAFRAHIRAVRRAAVDLLNGIGTQFQHGDRAAENDHYMLISTLHSNLIRATEAARTAFASFGVPPSLLAPAVTFPEQLRVSMDLLLRVLMNPPTTAADAAYIDPGQSAVDVDDHGEIIITARSVSTLVHMVMDVIKNAAREFLAGLQEVPPAPAAFMGGGAARPVSAYPSTIPPPMLPPGPSPAARSSAAATAAAAASSRTRPASEPLGAPPPPPNMRASMPPLPPPPPASSQQQHPMPPPPLQGQPGQRPNSGGSGGGPVSPPSRSPSVASLRSRFANAAGMPPAPPPPAIPPPLSSSSLNRTSGSGSGIVSPSSSSLARHPNNSGSPPGSRPPSSSAAYAADQQQQHWQHHDSSTVSMSATSPVVGGLRLFLLVGNDTKKITVSPAPHDLNEIRQLFLAKFPTEEVQAAVTAEPDVGVAMPATVYIRDPTPPHVEYELEDMVDVVHGATLILRVPPAPAMVPAPPSTVASPLLPDDDGESFRYGPPSPDDPFASFGMNAVAAAHLASVRSLRTDLQGLRTSLTATTATMRTYTSSISTQVRAAVRMHAMRTAALAADHSGTATDAAAWDGDPASPNFTRPTLERTKTDLTQALTGLGDRVADLEAVAAQLRGDMLSRGSIPTRAALAYAQAEAEELQRAVTLADEQMAAVAPAWKRVWEHELARVVGEQAVLEDAAHALDAARAKLATVNEVTANLDRVVALTAANPAAAAAVVESKRSTRTFSIAMDTSGSSDGYYQPDYLEGAAPPLSSVLAELTTVLDAESAEATSERRVRAAARTERLRAWELEHRGKRGDDREFARELAAFVAAEVGSGKGLRRASSGGIEAVEQRRRERDQAIVQAAWDEARSQSPLPPKS
ncbi:actin interacting protein 3-domain-containing protein [Blastocladiella britannica]|nr:actin interacting protein 3-domain-containing protein [Blastocladiella britannica]